MDPMSITGFALTTAAAVYTVSQTLAAFISKVGQVDESLTELHVELNFLHGEVNSIRTCLQHPGFIAASRSFSEHSQKPLLVQLQGLLEGCTATVGHLGVIVHDFSQAESGNFAKKLKTQWRLGARTDEINVLRQRIQNYRSSMQLSLTTLQVYQQIQSPERGLDELYAKIDNLTKVIEAKSAFFNDVKASLEAKERQGLKVSDEDTKIIGTFEDIRRHSINAKYVATAEADRRSTIAGTERGFGGANASILGNPLSKDRLRELERWIPSPEAQEYEEGMTSIGYFGGPQRQQLNMGRMFSAQERPSKSPLRPADPLADHRVGRWEAQDAEESPNHSLYEKQSSLSLSSTLFDQKFAAGDLRITFEEFQYGMSSAIAAAEARKKDPRKPFQEEDFTTIRRLLLQVGKPSWSERPRTYLVLRLIDEISAIEGFVLEGLKDIHFPYTEERLPKVISSVGKRHAFLEKQKLVMSNKIADLVRGGPHRHLNKSADIHFTVLRMLGSGGHGTVDHVRSKLSLQEYARKRIYRSRTFAKSKKALEMFEQEVHNLKRLEHIHLVKFVGSYTDPKYVGLITEPVADIDLRRYLMRYPFPMKDLANLRCFFGCLSSAVKYLHEQKCRHKDIKPGNILIKDEKVLITDFGTALDWTELGADMTDGRPEAYTNAYAAPEVVQARPRNSSADIWSLGCVYLDMLTVLKGETLERKKAFFEQKGSRTTSLHDNRPALEEWLDVLEGQSSEDQEPISWIKQMTHPNSTARIDANTLFTVIFQLDDPHYYALCCDGDSTSVEGSWRGSDTDEDVEAVTDSYTRSSEPSSADSKLAADPADTPKSEDSVPNLSDEESQILEPSKNTSPKIGPKTPEASSASFPSQDPKLTQGSASEASTDFVSHNPISIPPLNFLQRNPAIVRTQVPGVTPISSNAAPVPTIVDEQIASLQTSARPPQWNFQQRTVPPVSELVNEPKISPQIVPQRNPVVTQEEIPESVPEANNEAPVPSIVPPILKEHLMPKTSTSTVQPLITKIRAETITEEQAQAPPSSDSVRSPSIVSARVAELTSIPIPQNPKPSTQEAPMPSSQPISPTIRTTPSTSFHGKSVSFSNNTMPVAIQMPSTARSTDSTQGRKVPPEGSTDFIAPLSIKKSVRSQQNPLATVSLATSSQVAELPAEPVARQLATEGPTILLTRSTSQRDSKAFEPSMVHRTKSAATLTSTIPSERPGLSHHPKFPPFAPITSEDKQPEHQRPSVKPVEARLVDYFINSNPRLEALLVEIQALGKARLSSYLKDALELIHRGSKKCYPLHVAIGLLNDALAKEVLDIIVRTQTVNVNGVDADYSSPLHKAVGLGRLQLVEYLLNHGADRKQVNLIWQTPLHIAVERRRAKIVLFLLRVPNAMEIEAKDIKGRTPLHVSCQNGLNEITSILLDHGADIDSLDNGGNTPQMLSEAGEFHEVVALLVAIRESRMFPTNGKSIKKDKGPRQELPASSGPSKHQPLKEPRVETPYYSCHCDLCALLEKTWTEGDGSPDDGTRCICSKCLGDLTIRASIDFDVLKSSIDSCDCKTCSERQSSEPKHIEKKLEVEQLLLVDTESNKSGNIDPVKPVEPVPVLLAKTTRYLGDAHYEELIKAQVPKSCACEDCKSEKSDQYVKALEAAGFEGKLSYRLNPDKALLWAMSKMADWPLAEGVIRLLLFCGADVDIVDEGGRTPLHLAVSQGNVIMTQLLLERGADANVRRKDSFTQGDEWPPLHYAVVNNLCTIAYILLKHNETSINYQPASTRRTVIHNATAADKHEMLALLLQHGPNLELKDAESATALHLAVLRRSRIAADLLIGAGANIEAGTYKPLAMAIESRNWDMVKLLVDHGANVRCECGTARCALMFAVLVGDTEIVKILLNTPAIYDINTQDATGRTVVHMLAVGWPDVVMSMGTQLLMSRADINAMDSNGDTPLHAAASVSNYTAIRFLTMNGADAHLKNKAGLSPLDVAEQKKDKIMVKNMGGRPKKRWMFS